MLLIIYAIYLFISHINIAHKNFESSIFSYINNTYNRYHFSCPIQ